jgi:tRNA threonylcarbamoyladenosine biosynthesis protein TsaE
VEFDIVDEQKMEALGRSLYQATSHGMFMALSGDLGAGKTTFVRGFLRAMGYSQSVKSPTYTLVETYELVENTVYHFDFYRLNSPQELDFIGIRDYFEPGVFCLVEWPEKATNYLPKMDLMIYITINENSRTVKLQAESKRGQHALQTLKF